MVCSSHHWFWPAAQFPVSEAVPVSKSPFQTTCAFTANGARRAANTKWNRKRLPPWLSDLLSQGRQPRKRAASSQPGVRPGAHEAMRHCVAGGLRIEAGADRGALLCGNARPASKSCFSSAQRSALVVVHVVRLALAPETDGSERCLVEAEEVGIIRLDRHRAV